MYFNPKNNYTAPHYYYPYGNETLVQGTQGLGFKPDTYGDDLQMWSAELLSALTLHSLGGTTYKDTGCQKYGLADQVFEMGVL